MLQDCKAEAEMLGEPDLLLRWYLTEFRVAGMRLEDGTAAPSPVVALDTVIRALRLAAAIGPQRGRIPELLGFGALLCREFLPDRFRGFVAACLAIRGVLDHDDARADLAGTVLLAIRDLELAVLHGGPGAIPDADPVGLLRSLQQTYAGLVSCQSSESLERIAQHVGKGLWLQLYLDRDCAAAADWCARAETAGCAALVVTADAPVYYFRHREKRPGFRFPEGDGVSSPPIQVSDDLIFGGGMLGRAPGWSDLEWLCAATRLPVWIKGVMQPEDAGLALLHGAAGVIVSNHGGRVLDGVLSTVEALPEVLQAVAGRAPVLVDGGIRRGTDVAKALALGADAVLVGRPALHGLMVGGAAGVAHCLKIWARNCKQSWF